MSTWQSQPINLDGEVLDVKAENGHVILGRTVTSVDAQDIRLTPDEADILASALREGKAHAEVKS